MKRKSIPSLPDRRLSSHVPHRVSDTFSKRILEVNSDHSRDLLGLLLSLPIEEGPLAVVSWAVEQASATLPSVKLGVYLVLGPKEGWWIRREEGAIEQARFESTPSRLFVRHDVEARIPLPNLADSFVCVAGEHSKAAEDTLTVLAEILDRAISLARHQEELAREKEQLTVLSDNLGQLHKLASLGEIAAGMVHELNNPLTSILAYVDYLQRRWQQREDVSDDVERLSRIQESATRLLRLSKDIVSYARPAKELEQPVSLHSVLERALGFCEHVFLDSQVRIERKYVEDSPTVVLAHEQMTQVFVNLFTNACHAMPTGGVLEVSTEQCDGEGACLIHVKDSGFGIMPEHLPRIFLPFFTTKEGGRGTGLGLAIVKSIVDAHHGSITVESVPGNGATFTIQLPMLR